MKSQLLTLSGVTPSTAESRLREYLQGLDTRLTQVSPNQVILAGPHARALRDAYTKAGASTILQQAGVVKTTPLSDSEVVAVLRTRDSEATSPPQDFATLAGLPSDWHLDNTRTRTAWQMIAGAPDAIDWLDVRVGHADLSKLPGKAPGWHTTSGDRLRQGRDHIPKLQTRSLRRLFWR